MSADPSLVRFRTVVEGALAHLESRRQEINDLNVFPVADGDTGDNMALTLRACSTELDRLATARSARSTRSAATRSSTPSPARRCSARAATAASSSRQLIRGAAEELISRPGELVDPMLIGARWRAPPTAPTTRCATPAEGTMLTVMREMAASASRPSSRTCPTARRLGPDADAALQNELLADILERAIEAGEESVKRGPELLPVLREAGVVDAGGYGVTIIFAGIVAALRGTEAPELEHHAPRRRGSRHPEHESSTYRYCTNFAVTGHDLDAHAWIAPLEAIGDSVLVVGDAATLKVHVHTDEPERGDRAVFAGAGEVSRLDVADMHVQVEERTERALVQRPRRRRSQRCGARGGLRRRRACARCSRASASTRSTAAPTLNPSTYELLAGIHDVAAEEVVVLPNSANVIMAAERAAELSDKAVRVVADALPAGRPGRGDRAAAQRERGGERGRDGRRARARPHRRRRARRARGPGRPLRRRRRGRLRRRRARRLGRPGGARCATCSAGSRDGAELVTCIAGDGAPLDARRDRRAWCPTASRSSTRTAASRRGGGWSPPSSADLTAALATI